MAPHSSTLAWKIPWTEEPGRLQSMGSLRGRHDFTFTHWRRKWQPTPVFLPGESQGRRSLVGCHLWGRTESDTTEVTQQQQQHFKFLCCIPLKKLKEKMERAFKWKLNNPAGVILQRCRTGKMGAGSFTVASETTKTFQQASGGCQAF